MPYIDTRDLAEELDELEVRQALTEALTDPESQVVEDDTDPLGEEETKRLEALRELRDEIGDEWPHGETMIPVEDFVEYAKELADDIGTITEVSWPLSHIDWQAAADELAHDYTEVEWEGASYYVRAS
jgi:hypothetical protein